MNFPALHGNWVDFVIVLFILFYIWDGWGKGFFVLIVELVSFVGAFIIGLKFYPIVSKLLIDNFSFPRGLANAAGFFILGIVSEQLLVTLGQKVYAKIPEKWYRHKLNRYLSVVPLLSNGIIIVAFLLTLGLSLPIHGYIKAGIANSKLAHPLIRHTQRIEKTLSGIFSEAVSDSLNFITVRPISREQVKLNFTQQTLTVDEGAEREMLTSVNQERRTYGLKELQSDPKLRDVARAYARDMFERGYFSHYNPEGESPFDRMEKVGISYLTAGENLALTPSVAIAHQGLMESKGHRENILNPEFGKVGIGVIDGGIYGKMFVQEFTD